MKKTPNPIEYLLISGPVAQITKEMTDSLVSLEFIGTHQSLVFPKISFPHLIRLTADLLSYDQMSHNIFFEYFKHILHQLVYLNLNVKF